ncbi:GH25 family lysozyme [Micromonospora sp. NPDC047548]|uniref:GH25 family lysozyme n=1 Tax=Micromonospora sp. NPDC047548 TaxID=3155624 RepID=UPI0033C38D69
MDPTRRRRWTGPLTAVLLTAALLQPSPAHAADPYADGGGWAGRGSVQQQSPTNTAAVAPPAGYPVGIDVSSHDWENGRSINWSTEAANGITFTYVKATEGTSYVNSHYSSDYNTAKSVGIFAGAYAWGRPDLGNPVGQADHFVDTMQWTSDGKTLPPFLDIEWPYKSNGTYVAPYPCYGLSQPQMVSWINSFLGRVEARIGRKPAIYTNVNWWNPCTGSSTAFSAYPLDISSCNSSPPSAPGWGNQWTFWQYEIPDCGRGATRDWDVFNGSYAQLAQFAGGSASAQSSGSVVFNGVFYEFARASDGSVRYWYGTGGPWSSAQSLGGGLASDPVATVFNGNLYVFGRGTDGSVKYWYANGGAWSAVQTVTGSSVTGAVTASVFNGNLYVFGRGADGTARYWFGNGGPWSATQSVGAAVIDAPLASTVFNGNLYLFATGTDGSVRYWYGNGGPWSGMQTVTGSSGIGGGLSSTVFNGNLYVFARGTDGAMKYWYGNGGPWSAQQSIPGSTAVAGAVSSGVFNGNLYAFARGTDGTARYWFGNGGPWSSMQTIPGSTGLG